MRIFILIFIVNIYLLANITNEKIDYKIYKDRILENIILNEKQSDVIKYIKFLTKYLTYSLILSDEDKNKILQKEVINTNLKELEEDLINIEPFLNKNCFYYYHNGYKNLNGVFNTIMNINKSKILFNKAIEICNEHTEEYNNSVIGLSLIDFLENKKIEKQINYKSIKIEKYNEIQKNPTINSVYNYYLFMTNDIDFINSKLDTVILNKYKNKYGITLDEFITNDLKFIESYLLENNHCNMNLEIGKMYYYGYLNKNKNKEIAKIYFSRAIELCEKNTFEYIHAKNFLNNY